MQHPFPNPNYYSHPYLIPFCLFKLYAASPNKMVAYLRGTAAGDDNNQHKTETIKMSVWIMYRYLASEKKDVDFIF